MQAFDQQKAGQRYNRLREECFLLREGDYRQAARRAREMSNLCLTAVQNGYIFVSPEEEDPDALWLYLTRQELCPSRLRPITAVEAAHYRRGAFAQHKWERPFSRVLTERFDEIVHRFPERERAEAVWFLSAVINYLKRGEIDQAVKARDSREIRYQQA